MYDRVMIENMDADDFSQVVRDFLREIYLCGSPSVCVTKVHVNWAILLMRKGIPLLEEAPIINHFLSADLFGLQKLIISASKDVDHIPDFVCEWKRRK